MKFVSVHIYISVFYSRGFLVKTIVNQKETGTRLDISKEEVYVKAKIVKATVTCLAKSIVKKYCKSRSAKDTVNTRLANGIVKEVL